MVEFWQSQSVNTPRAVRLFYTHFSMCLLDIDFKKFKQNFKVKDIAGKEQILIHNESLIYNDSGVREPGRPEAQA